MSRRHHGCISHISHSNSLLANFEVKVPLPFSLRIYKSIEIWGERTHVDWAKARGKVYSVLMATRAMLSARNCNQTVWSVVDELDLGGDWEILYFDLKHFFKSLKMFSAILHSTRQSSFWPYMSRWRIRYAPAKPNLKPKHSRSLCKVLGLYSGFPLSPIPPTHLPSLAYNNSYVLYRETHESSIESFGFASNRSAARGRQRSTTTTIFDHLLQLCCVSQELGAYTVQSRAGASLKNETEGIYF